MKKILLFILLLSLLVVFGKNGWIELYRSKQIRKELEERNLVLETRNHSLSDEIANLQDRVYVEDIIKKELGYIRRNEVVLDLNQE